MPELMATCAYCGLPASPRFMLCGECWAAVCGEVQDRVTEARHREGEGSAYFKSAVEGAVKFLLWKQGLAS